MEVLIVSKTKMNHNNCCVGGLLLHNNQSVRLLNPGNYNQPADTDLQIGQVWDMTLTPRPILTPPHIEDVIIQQRNFIRIQGGLSAFIRNRGLVNWNGGIDLLFNGHLHWTSGGSGYIDANAGNFPPMSTGYWISDTDLGEYTSYNKVRYMYNQHRNLIFKGYQQPIDPIPAGTLIRVSLTRPHAINGINGCWLQLSGWYE